MIAGGERHAVDAVVCATGFDMLPHPTSRLIKGKDGVPLSEAYDPANGHYLALSHPKFPNLFQLFGPGSLGHNNLVTQIEIQADHIIGVLEAMQRKGARVVAPTEEAQRRYLDERKGRVANMVLHTAHASWYLNKSRDVWTHHAGNQLEYWWRVSRPDLSAYRFE